jgi:hypothetical protein
MRKSTKEKLKEDSQILNQNLNLGLHVSIIRAVTNKKKRNQ